jgi:hypothetical protein
MSATCQRLRATLRADKRIYLLDCAEWMYAAVSHRRQATAVQGKTAQLLTALVRTQRTETCLARASMGVIFLAADNGPASPHQRKQSVVAVLFL